MPIDFPTSPTSGDTYTYSGRVWKYNGDGWAAVPVPDLTALNPTGTILSYGGITTPTGYLLCDGSAVSRTTYATLFSSLSASKGTFTITIASPGVITLTSHGFVGGEAIYLTTTGALPTGLTANTTTYYVLATSLTSNTFRISATRGGTAINTSGTQSGTHTLYHAPYGVSASTTFLLPDLRGRMPVGLGTHADTVALGYDEGSAVANRRPKHQHTVYDPGHQHRGEGGSWADGTAAIRAAASGGDQPFTTSVVTGIKINPAGVASDTTSPSDAPAHIILNYIIKT